MAKERDKLTGHAFDGIEEYDNPLPPWWLYLFYITLAWAVIYFAFYHITGMGANQTQEYATEMKAFAGSSGSAGAENYDKLSALKDDINISEGKDIFIKNCVACHASDGGGGIGPNLCDDYWIHGSSFGNVVKTITIGVPQKGMITWKGVLNKEQIMKVASYIMTFRGTTPVNPKAPQGIMEPSEGN